MIKTNKRTHKTITRNSYWFNPVLFIKSSVSIYFKHLNLPILRHRCLIHLFKDENPSKNIVSTEQLKMGA